MDKVHLVIKVYELKQIPGLASHLSRSGLALLFSPELHQSLPHDERPKSHVFCLDRDA